VHLGIGGWRIKTVASSLPATSLAPLRTAVALPAGPPPAGPSPAGLAANSGAEAG